jgi:isoaspartyl peptidase/L-asparaginase-like protein (Ntn-hydrolase superfamily)
VEVVRQISHGKMVLNHFLQKQRRTEYEEKLKSSGTGTVGCVAFDQNGKIAAATSTGGKDLKFLVEYLIQQRLLKLC